MPQRVLLISNMYPSPRDPTYGRFVERCALALTDAGIEVETVTMPRHTSLLRKLLSYLRFSLQANLRVMTRQHDCIYIHHPLHSLLACLPALFLLKRSLALNFHGHDLLPVKQRGWVLQRWLQPWFESADVVVVPSRHFKALFDNRLGRRRREGARVFYSGGVDDRYLDVVPLPIASRPRSALFLSRWVSDKGWPTFIEVARLLRSRFADFEFTLAGVGPDADAIHAAVDAAGLRPATRIVVTTRTEDNQRLYATNRYFVFPTRFDESLALVNLEAMASGCIVLSCDFPTAAEYIDHGVNGLRIGLDNFASECADHISRLETNADGQCIGDAARRTASQFRESRIMRSLPTVLGLHEVRE
jgi:L-malate glycosyltransferase